MGGDKFSPDELVYFDWGFVNLNATIVFTWIVMAILVVGSWLITRKLSSGKRMSRWQNLLEVVVRFLRQEIRGISRQSPDFYLPFIGTLFIFIAFSSVLAVVPGFVVPAASLSTTFALAACVFVAVPVFGIANQGVLRYLKNYVRPSPFMLPFNIIGELSRTLALAVRLFGNTMSGVKIIYVLGLVAPFGPAVIMNSMGLLIGVIQAYIFAILAMVYISSGMQSHEVLQKKAEAAPPVSGPVGRHKTINRRSRPQRPRERIER